MPLTSDRDSIPNFATIPFPFGSEISWRVLYHNSAQQIVSYRAKSQFARVSSKFSPKPLLKPSAYNFFAIANKLQLHLRRRKEDPFANRICLML